MAADHHQLGTVGFLDKPVPWAAASDSTRHAHIGIPLLPASEPFGKHLVPFNFALSAVRGIGRQTHLAARV